MTIIPITGANGRIGRTLCEGLRGRYDLLRCSTATPPPISSPDHGLHRLRPNGDL